MNTNGLATRAKCALGVVAVSLFLAICLANFGTVAADDALPNLAWHLEIAGWFVEVFGAGAYALVALPFVWGLVVYFREATPSIPMRAAGTVLLACSIAMISGLLQRPEPGRWAGGIGSLTVSLTAGLGSLIGAKLALAIAWTASTALFLASLVWATDWVFHTLRKGEIDFTVRPEIHIATEPAKADLRDHNEAPQAREFVRMETAGAEAAASMSEPVAVAEPIEAKRVPEGFSANEQGGRVMLRGPQGYKGVEFLPTNDELAEPETREPEYVRPSASTTILDDEISFTVEEFVVSNDAKSETEAADTENAEMIIDVLPASAYTESETADRATPVTLDFDGEAVAADQAPQPEPQPEPQRIDAGDDRPRSGIGLPDDSPFVDEFFVMDGGAATPSAGDGASHHEDVAATFGATSPLAEAPEIAQVTQEAVTEDAGSAESVEPIIFDEVLFTPASFDLIDDVISEEVPAPIAARSAAIPPTQQAIPPAQQAADESSVDSETRPSAAASTSREAALRHVPDLSRLQGMVLDPLFYDAVNAVMERGRASGMVLQRTFGVGHARGLRVLEQMEAAGIVGAEDTNGSRDLLVTREAWDAFTGTRSA